jgi:ATP-dependent DNA helicase DinG
VKLPDWASTIRPLQSTAADQAITAFNNGSKVVLLDAPTGTGKTLIAEIVRQELSVRGLYVCSTLNLQDQFAHDFPDAAILRGRSNYPTCDSPHEFPQLTAADCNKERVNVPACRECDPDDDDFRMHCRWCHPVSSCPYELSKRDAIMANLTCTNLSYFLYESNYIGNIAHNRGLVVLDEADLLEDGLLNFISVTITPRAQKEYGIDYPAKKTVESTWLPWAEQTYEKLQGLSSKGKQSDLRDIRRHNAIKRLRDNVGRLLDKDRGLAGGNWIYTGYDSGSIIFRPIRVDEYAREFLWRHGERFLLMSATMISFSAMAEILGIE